MVIMWTKGIKNRKYYTEKYEEKFSNTVYGTSSV